MPPICAFFARRNAVEEPPLSRGAFLFLGAISGARKVFVGRQIHSASEQSRRGAGGFAAVRRLAIGANAERAECSGRSERGWSTSRRKSACWEGHAGKYAAAKCSAAKFPTAKRARDPGSRR